MLWGGDTGACELKGPRSGNGVRQMGGVSGGQAKTGPWKELGVCLQVCVDPGNGDIEKEKAGLALDPSSPSSRQSDSRVRHLKG